MAAGSGAERARHDRTRPRRLLGTAHEHAAVGEEDDFEGFAAEAQGVRATAHKETPGLGDKIDPKKTPWILQFNGLSLGNPLPEKWKVKKDGGPFDQFSGATITPRAVVTGIRQGLEFFAANKPNLLEAR